jgi:hypothetical protein
MSNLLDDHQKFSLPFVMAIKVFRIQLTGLDHRFGPPSQFPPLKGKKQRIAELKQFRPPAVEGTVAGRVIKSKIYY